MKMRFWVIFSGLAIVWGASFLWIKIALEELSPLNVATFRIGLGMTGLLLASAVMREKLPINPRAWLLFLGPALLNTALPFPLIAWAETRISSGMASVLNGTVPLFTFLMAHFFFQDERLTLKRVFGLFCGFLGVVVLASKALFESGQSSSLLGMAAMLSAVGLYALANVYAKKYLRGQRPLVTSTMTLTLAFLILLPFTLVLDRPVQLPQRPMTWLALGWLGLLGLSTAYVCYFYLVEHWGPSRVSTIAYLFPFIGMLLGIVFLQEVLTWRLGVGACLIVLALWIINHSGPRVVANVVEGVRDNTIILRKKS